MVPYASLPLKLLDDFPQWVLSLVTAKGCPHAYLPSLALTDCAAFSRTKSSAWPSGSSKFRTQHTLPGLLVIFFLFRPHGGLVLSRQYPSLLQCFIADATTIHPPTCHGHPSQGRSEDFSLAVHSGPAILSPDHIVPTLY